MEQANFLKNSDTIIIATVIANKFAKEMAWEGILIWCWHQEKSRVNNKLKYIFKFSESYKSKFQVNWTSEGLWRNDLTLAVLKID